MRFTAISAAAALAFAASALADTTAGFDAITAPGDGDSVPAGESYTIKWEPGTYTTGTVTISLIGGADSAHLNTVETIATDVESSAGSYVWAVESTLGDLATYGIQITLDSNTTIYQYSFPFPITGGSDSGSSSSSSGSSSVASSTSVSSDSSAATYSASTTASGKTSTTASTLATVTTTSAGSTTAGSSGAAGTTITSTKSASATASKTTSATTTAATGAAPRVAAGYMALFGGLAAVVFAQ
ncbi:Ser-Thr-rich glycosyl-phosphatidyl-inositol-anchored membrane family-domain-containing protein [Xylariales sp. PMI_506]|nr:Ser-Thr-rich glycosyl-phosphatidyl-inositol-anchored membrane family-domain-containing protein [Xylariales sp. PMI_506]